MSFSLIIVVIGAGDAPAGIAVFYRLCFVFSKVINNLVLPGEQIERNGMKYWGLPSIAPQGEAVRVVYPTPPPPSIATSARCRPPSPTAAITTIPVFFSTIRCRRLCRLFRRPPPSPSVATVAAAAAIPASAHSAVVAAFPFSARTIRSCPSPSARCLGFKSPNSYYHKPLDLTGPVQSSQGAHTCPVRTKHLAWFE